MKIALIGYGKMGKLIEEVALSRGHEIVSIIDVDNQEEFESERFASADVAIEFTSPTAAYGNYLKAFAKGVKVVSGSTGWMKEHGDDVSRACSEGGQTLFWASNFSVGMALFSAVNRYLARLMNRFPQYDVKIEETHHVHKLDHPSGTAITLAEEIVEALDRKTDWELGRVVEGPWTEGESCGKTAGHGDGQGDPCGKTAGHSGGQVKGFVMGPSRDMVRIDSIRRGEVPGIHTVQYDSAEDSITITHDAHSRRGFALGAVLAAEYTKDHRGLLTISDLFQE